MPTFKIEKNRDFTVMSNHHLRNKNLSLKGKGLMSFFLSLPEDWDYSLDGLVSVLKEGEDAIKTALKELKEHKYLKIVKSKDANGLFDYTYEIYEIPYEENPEGENPALDNPALELPAVDTPVLENPPQINTNIININNKYNICSISEKFEELWKMYPRKAGKASAFRHYSNWIKGKFYAGRKEKLTDIEMRQAIEEYLGEIKENKTEEQFMKMGSTFFNEAIFEYANRYKKKQKEKSEVDKQKEIYKENHMSEEEYYSSIKDKGKRYE
ncbi:MAG: hypothetical protein HFJ40_00955 [Clostridia bacterium]|nr:hypothetical protein [Clostridia bacterium]